MRFPWSKQPPQAKRARHPVVGQRSFAAAEVNRLVAGWRVDYGYTPQETRQQLPMIRALSRELFKNNPHAKRFAQSVETNIVGRGYALKCMPEDAPGRMDKAAASELESAFWDWASHPEYCDVAGARSFAEIGRVNVKGWARDGEYITQIIRGVSGNPYGFALKLLRVDLLDHNHCVRDAGNGNSIQNGVELNADGKPVAYWFRDGSWMYNSLTPVGDLKRVPAEDIIHGFTPEDPAQVRGFPWGHACMLKLKMLELYDLAELTAARDEACSVRTYYAPRGQDDEVEDISEDEGVAGALTAPKEPGQSEVLPLGWRQEVHTPQHPNAEHAAAKKDWLRDVATGYGVEYATWANDLSEVNYSSIRAGTLAERDMWQVYQDRFADTFCSRVFREWLKMYLTLPVTKLPMSKLRKLEKHEFRGRRWTWVDPANDARAAETARRYGWRTDTQITSDMGGDYGDNVSEINDETVTVKGTVLETIHAARVPNQPVVAIGEDAR